jgi:putative restriction endonuclease
VAFDTGLLTVDASLQVRVSSKLAEAIRTDPLTRQYYGYPPLRDTILLPDRAQLPGRKYLDWHETNIFVALPVSGHPDGSLIPRIMPG